MDDDTPFPALAGESYVEYAQARTRYVTGVAKDELVTRLHLVALTDAGHVVVCRSVEDWRFLPGGTREEGESLVELARRELMEEAGATLVGDLRYFAAHEADSEREEPCRPYFPHPRSYWAYAVARVEVTGAPLNPPDGEEVVEVLALPVLEAADYLRGTDDPVHAEVLLHAHVLGLVG